ncbi:phosphatidylinositol 4-phosphate 3-kinase C2 domain-containing subunit alpha-like isoform X2 [Lineus longissimus]|uniref:phosphatidylinositol 4-phosphate 3-kinase C2 domain-containing subunit alpha-like isoform X2 n=1 Tax=Lineus longissimus TaxID=88925 RepID=UPI00315CE7A4
MELELLEDIPSSRSDQSSSADRSRVARKARTMHPTSRIAEQEQVRSTSVSPRPRPRSSDHARSVVGKSSNGTPVVPPRPPIAAPRKNIPPKVDTNIKTGVVTPSKDSSPCEMNLMAFSPTEKQAPSQHGLDDFDPVPRGRVSPGESGAASADLYAVMRRSATTDSESDYASITSFQDPVQGMANQLQRTTMAPQSTDSASFQKQPDHGSGSSHGIMINPVSGIASFNREKPPPAIPPRPKVDQGKFIVPTRPHGNQPAPVKSHTLPVQSYGARPKTGSLSADLDSSTAWKRSGMATSASSDFSDRQRHASDVEVATRPSENELMTFGYNHDRKISTSYFDPLLNPVLTEDELSHSLEFQGFRRKKAPNPFPELGRHLPPVQGFQAGSREMSGYDPNYEGLQLSGEYAMYQDDSSLDGAEEFNLEEIQDPFSISTLTLLAQQRDAAPPLPPKSKEVKKVPVKDDVEPDPATPLPPKSQPTVTPEKSIIGWNDVHNSLVPTFVADEEAQAFCDAMNCLKTTYSIKDQEKNAGIVLSPVLEHVEHPSMTIKLTVQARFAKDPVIFTCDINSEVHFVISHVLYMICDDTATSSADVKLENYILKVYARQEFLLSDSILGDYEYVQHCLKLDLEIKFTLLDTQKVKRPYERNPPDLHPMEAPRMSELSEYKKLVSRESLMILMDTFTKEIEKLLNQAMESEFKKIQTNALLGAVKAVCTILNTVETTEITLAVKRLQALSKEQGHDERPSSTYNDLIAATNKYDELNGAVQELCTAVINLIRTYCNLYNTDFVIRFPSHTSGEKEDASQLCDSVIIHVATAHHFDAEWPTKNSHKKGAKTGGKTTRYDHFRVSCGLFYGGRPLCKNVMTSQAVITTDSFQPRIVWDEWIQFPSMGVSMLPRETRLALTLVGFRTEKDGSSNEVPKQIKVNLGWAVLPMFDYKGHLTQGDQLLALWPNEGANPSGSTQCNILKPDAVLLQVSLPDFGHPVIFPDVKPTKASDLSDEKNAQSLKRPFEALHPYDQEQLLEILGKDCVTFATPAENEVLWEKRFYLHDRPEALPKVLLAAPNWNWSSLVDIYRLIDEWTPMKPTDALELLLPLYADEHVRNVAISWIKKMCADEICDYLPQLLQALKYELYHQSPLSQFLLEMAMTNVRIAHQLYWLFKEASLDVRCCWRFHLMKTALMSMVGNGFKEEIEREEHLTKGLTTAAICVKAAKDAKDRDMTLLRELGLLFEEFEDQSIGLPLDPSLVITGIELKSCSYFTSNAFPLKLVFKHDEPRADPHCVMFKVGDDLRQDMLTMQLINIMDKMWLKSGLDLKIITFRCLSTGERKGLVELVSESQTLRQIQDPYGVTGSFKDRPLAEWLKKYNPTELDYRKAVVNFTRSCAGYCVATYILGICDRHNDNIMLKQTGHMFHIDFGKFLGDAQRFGNIKRDRVPFVFTSDMAYVINGGDKVTDNFQEFVDLCCEAFNVLRKNGAFLITLLRLMSASGIPGINHNAAMYVQRVLLPDCSDTEAIAAFTRMIQGSLKSVSTQFNFFLHAMAQKRFSGHREGMLLSFIPKTYSVTTDGRITNVVIEGYQKRYSPEKFYIYIIRVDREDEKVPNFIMRKYPEFLEFHKRLVEMFPMVKLPSLPGKIMIGRSNVKAVADKRKSELEIFLRELLALAPEISECDLIYTFFHPMLRDEQEVNKSQGKVRVIVYNAKMLGKPDPSPTRILRRPHAIQGQLKLSLVHKEGGLHVMIMHAKDLASEESELPDPYVKMYLLPDSAKQTKRKTEIARRSNHPTFNEMFVYRVPLDIIKRKHLQLTVWNYDMLKENEFMGALYLDLSTIDLGKETVAWHKLGLYQMP